MKEVLILSTPQDIAEGLEMFLEKRNTTQPDLRNFEKEKMKVAEAANFIDVGYPTLCKWINSGKVPVHGKGRTRFVLKSELIEAYKNLNK